MIRRGGASPHIGRRSRTNSVELVVILLLVLPPDRVSCRKASFRLCQNLSALQRPLRDQPLTSKISIKNDRFFAVWAKKTSGTPVVIPRTDTSRTARLNSERKAGWREKTMETP